MKFYNVLVVLFCISFFSCKKVDTKVNEETIDKVKEKVVPVVKIDTSYKKNIRLFDQYFYLMPLEAVLQVKNESIDKNNSEEVVLTYNEKRIVLDKKFFYENNKLKSIQLKGDSKDGSSVLSLFKEKYGNPNVVEKQEKSIHTETWPTKIINYNSPFPNSSEIEYNPKIHREISIQELKQYCNNPGFILDSREIANLKLRITGSTERGNDFYKIMKDVTKDEFVKIRIEVAVKKNEYTEINRVTYCKWQDGKKEIQLKFTKSTKFIGNQLPKMVNGYNGLLIEYSSLADKVIVSKPEVKIDSTKELKAKSLKAI